MKKIIAVLLTMIVLTALTACNKTGTENIDAGRVNLVYSSSPRRSGDETQGREGPKGAGDEKIRLQSLRVGLRPRGA